MKRYLLNRRARLASWEIRDLLDRGFVGIFAREGKGFFAQSEASLVTAHTLDPYLALKIALRSEELFADVEGDHIRITEDNLRFVLGL